MEILIKNLQKKITIKPLQIHKIVQAILRHERIRKASLSIVFVTSQKIRALNKKYLKRSYATDVLAFDLSEGRELAGDVIISTDTLRQNAKKYQTSIKQETTLYVIHGLLHLLGYDDHAPKDISRMRKKEEDLVQYLKKRKHIS